ncbi:MAG: metal-dependent transcriptional regulator [Candidatus Latescibacterota bacterium]
MFEEVWRAYEANELTHSAAHYLMAVHQLRREHGYARVSDVAKHLQITKGSVSAAMKQLKERGYVQEDHNRFLELTADGCKVVQEVEATRLVVQKFLTEGLGMDEDDARIDACKVEHLLSSDARVRLVCFLRSLFSGERVSEAFLDRFRSKALDCRHGDVSACRLCDDFCFEHPELTQVAR